MGVTNQEGHLVTDRKWQWVSAALRASYRQNSYVAKNKTNGRYCKEQIMMVCWQPLTFAQILAALTMGKRESAFGLTVTSMPGNSFESFSSYFSAGPTVSTNTCRTPERWRSVKKLKAEWKWHNRGRGHDNAELHQISALPAIHHVPTWRTILTPVGKTAGQKHEVFKMATAQFIWEIQKFISFFDH